MKRGYKWVPIVDENLCTGCGACVEACGPRCLEILDNVAVLIRPNDCGSEEHCIKPCPESCIRMAWVLTSGDFSVGEWKRSDEEA